MSKKILILIEAEFQDLEALYPFYRLKEENFDVKVAGSKNKVYKGKYGYPLETDGSIEDFNPDDFDAIVIPGGWAPDFMRRNQNMIDFVKAANGKNKIIAAICHAGWMLASSGACKGKKVTCFSAIKDDLINAGAIYEDKEVVVDKNLITSRKPDDLPAFCKEIINQLKK
jgi:protease I